MCETPVIFPTERAFLVGAVFHENVAKKNAYMTDKIIMVVYVGHLFYNPTANFDKIVMNLFRHQRELNL